MSVTHFPLQRHKLFVIINEYLLNFRIEMAGHDPFIAIGHNFEGLLIAESRFIGSLRNQSIKDIGDGNNAAGQRYLSTFIAIGVTARLQLGRSHGGATGERRGDFVTTG